MQNWVQVHWLIGIGGVLATLLSISPAGFADYVPGDSQPLGDDNTAGGINVYVPPPDSEPPRGSHTGGGSRGCGGEIAALAPRLSAIGQTASTHPTLVWYVYDADAEPLELHLYQYRADNSLKEVFIRPLGDSHPGYMAYTLPADDPDLQVGQTYVWQVVLYCDQNLEEVGQWTAADLSVVAPPASLTAPPLPDDPLQQAQRYGQAGLWYDALAAVYAGNSPELRAFRSALLLNLADLEAPLATATEPDLSQQLREIAGLDP